MGMGFSLRKNVGGKRKIRRSLFKSLHAAGGEQGAHLGDGGDGVKAEILKS